MIVYSGNKKEFQHAVVSNQIADKLTELLKKHKVHVEPAEINSWRHSLERMALIMTDPRICNDAQVALEYQIPLTSKRIDFMVGGNDGKKDHVVIVELKQWEKCTATKKENIVNTYVGKGYRDVPHPSYQAYSYAKLIENYNKAVRDSFISLEPCAYLHNYKSSFKNELLHEDYKEVIKEAPVFIAEDSISLMDYIASFIKKPSHKKLFDLIEHGKIMPSKSLQEAIGNTLNGNVEFMMIDEQQVAYATILEMIKNLVNDKKKHTIIVEGGPGTGKSVIAINLLAKIIQMEKSCFYVTKTSAPRTVYKKRLIKGKYKIGYLKGLFKSSGTFVYTPSNTFDCLLVDEAHRLKKQSGFYSNSGENQIKEIINSCRVSVFFIDEDQVVTTKDIGSIDQIKMFAKELDSELFPTIKLTSQFRCNGSDSYIAFLKDVLGQESTANYNGFDLDYDLQVFDSPTKMREALRDKNKNNKARMIAGYCYPWISQHKKVDEYGNTIFDIKLEDNYKAQWNFSTDEFAIDPDSFEQVGCIHSTQGLEFEYVGIIIGLDLRFENGRVITDPSKRAKSDASLKGYKDKGGLPLADKIIRNTYKTLLTRGQKGCYVYCQDKALGQYMKERIESVRKI